MVDVFIILPAKLEMAKLEELPLASCRLYLTLSFSITFYELIMLRCSVRFVWDVLDYLINVDLGLTIVKVDGVRSSHLRRLETFVATDFLLAFWDFLKLWDDQSTISLFHLIIFYFLIIIEYIKVKFINY